jgi:antitoxin CptB
LAALWNGAHCGTMRPMDTRRKKILHRARYRGFKEADLLIGGFAEEHIAAMSEADLDAFETLIEQPDHDLYAWATGASLPPSRFVGPVLDALRSFEASARIKGR